MRRPWNPTATEAAKARFARRRMAAAIRRGSLNSGTLADWQRRLDAYRRNGDRWSVLDFLSAYGAGIDTYCKPTRFDRGVAA